MDSEETDDSLRSSDSYEASAERRPVVGPVLMQIAELMRAGTGRDARRRMKSGDVKEPHARHVTRVRVG